MNVLLDTHVLIWLVNRDAPGASRLTDHHLEELQSPRSRVCFSAASIWEVAIKFARGGTAFTLSPMELRRSLLAERYEELGMTSIHAITAGALPPIHKDPFDRMLVGQAVVEELTLLTADAVLTGYPALIRLI